MAGILEYSAEDKKKIAKGLISLVPGSPENLDTIDGMGDGAVKILTSDAKKKIDGNTKPSKQVPDTLLLNNDDDALPGAKDILLSYIDEEKSNTHLQDPKKKQDLEAAMAASGYQVALDGNISDQERSYLDDFRARLNSGISIDAIFNQNYQIAQTKFEQEQKLAAEQAQIAKNETDLNNKYNAGLVYAGYLKPEDAGNSLASARAMATMIVNTVDSGKQGTVQAGMYDDMKTFKPNVHALEFLAAHTGNTAQLKVEADLESGDPKRMAMAQNFLALQGVKADGADIEANGRIYSKGFKDAAEAYIRKPLTLPEGIVENGVVNNRVLAGMAASGQLYLPENALTKDELEASKAYPPAAEAKGMSRESFIASRLIGDDPKRYEAILAKENDRRAHLSLSLDIQGMAKENVIANVKQNDQKLEATNLPPKFAEFVTKYAAENGGVIKVEQIPYLIDAAEGKATTLTGGIDVARLRGPLAGINDLDAQIKINPSAGDFEKNMTDVLTHAYAFQNAQAGVTMANISPELVAGFKDIAATQTKISQSLVVTQTQDFGLPQNFMSSLNAVSKNGVISPVQIASTLHNIDPYGAGKHINMSDPAGEVIRAGLENMYGQGDSTIDGIVENNQIDLKDPKQLALTLQIGIAMKDNTTLEQVRARPGVQVATKAAAEGFTGVNADPANKPAAVPEVKPGKTDPADPAATDKSKGWLSQWFGVNAAEAREVAPAAAQPAAATPRIKEQTQPDYTQVVPGL